MGSLALRETFKNAVYFGIAACIGLLLFTFSDGYGVFYFLGWILTLFAIIPCVLTLFTSGLAFITLFLTIPLYFDSETDKSDKFLLDLSSILSVIANLVITLYGYQILTEFASIGLPVFEPFGISFSVKNFSY